MMDTEPDGVSKHRNDGGIDIIRKYEVMIESLQQDLKKCKVEQARIRLEVDDAILENKNTTNVLSDVFHHINSEESRGSVENRECVENLQRQIAVMQLEKDSTFQLWQMALKAINDLEQELQEIHKDGKTTKHYENQVHNVKEIHSEAIKALETKLLEAKENFTNQQNLWELTRKERNNLESDKAELETKLMNIQSEILFKEETNRETIEKLEYELNVTKQRLETLSISKTKLEKELTEMRHFITRIVAKDDESKEKVAEAIELVETAVREREIVLHREAAIINEKRKLENRLANLSDEFMARLEKELYESKKNFEKKTENYIIEIKELKAELRDKATRMDRMQRECRLIEEELMKARQGTDNYMERSNLKVLELEQKFKDSQLRLEICEESLRNKFYGRIREYENQILELRETLANAEDHSRRNHVHTAKKMDDRIKEPSDDYKMKDAFERYVNLEQRLTCALNERESVTNELHSLQIIHNREMSLRENERRLFESRIRELQDGIRKANDLTDKSVVRADAFERQIKALEKALEKYRNQTVKQDEVKCANAEEKSMESVMIQEKYDKQISELTRYVKIHQKLSARWKEEAQSLTSKFDERYKSLRSKVNLLKKENEVLNNELMSWRKQVALCCTQATPRYDQGDGAR